MVAGSQSVDRYRASELCGEVGDEFPVCGLDFVDVGANVHATGSGRNRWQTSRSRHPADGLPGVSTPRRSARPMLAMTRCSNASQAAPSLATCMSQLPCDNVQPALLCQLNVTGQCHHHSRLTCSGRAAFHRFCCVRTAPARVRVDGRCVHFPDPRHGNAEPGGVGCSWR